MSPLRGLSFPICKMGTLTPPPSQGCCENRKGSPTQSSEHKPGAWPVLRKVIIITIFHSLPSLFGTRSPGSEVVMGIQEGGRKTLWSLTQQRTASLACPGASPISQMRRPQEDPVCPVGSIWWVTGARLELRTAFLGAAWLLTQAFLSARPESSGALVQVPPQVAGHASARPSDSDLPARQGPVFSWLRWVLAVACRSFSCSTQTQWWHVGSNSLTRDQTQGPCIGGLES